MTIPKKRSNQEWLDALSGKDGEQTQEQALLDIGNHLYPRVYHFLRARQQTIPHLRSLSPMELAAEAQDMIQNMFTEKLIPKKFAHLKKFSGTGNFLAWISKVQINYTVDQLRRKNFERVNPYFIVNKPDPNPSPEQQIGRDEVMGLLDECTKQLTPGRYEIFKAHFVNEESAKIIAKALDKKSSQIHTLIFHTRRNIRMCLINKGVTVDTLNDLF